MRSVQHSTYRTSESTGEIIEKWSSLIGIVTAIVGNILISFALNIQRYAHIRLGQEQDEEREHVLKKKKKEEKRRTQKDYGTQSDKAEERLRLNLEPDIWKNATSTADGDPAKLVQPRSSGTSLDSQSSTASTVKPPKEQSPPQRKTYLKSPYWWAGIILMTIGEAGNFLAYGFAPASIVSPLGVVALVSNCIIAPCLLKERFRKRDFWGVMFAIGGAVMIVLSAKSEEAKMGPNDVLAAIKRWEFETYLGITVALLILLVWASPRYGDKTILVDLGLVGLFGGYTALSTKGIASLLSDTLWRTLTFPITYVLILILVITALMQIRYVNRALQRFDSTQVIPIQFVLFTISVIIGSAVLYRDFESATKARIGKFFGGCVLTFMGVYFITSGRAQSHHELGEDGYDEEHEIDLRDEEQSQDEMYPPSGPQGRKPSIASTALATSVHTSRAPSKQPASPPRTPLRRESLLSTTSKDYDPTLTSNPWQSSSDLRLASHPPVSNRPTFHDGSVSSPLLPSQARSGRQTPIDADPSTPSRQSTLRRSTTRLEPGPLMSPLSPSFSAIVADQKRRSIRQPRLSAQRSKAMSGSRGGTEDSTAAFSSRLKGAEVPERAVEEDEGTQTVGRRNLGRSLSAAVGGFFQKKGKGKAARDEFHRTEDS